MTGSLAGRRGAAPRLRRLSPEELPALQRLLEACADWAWFSHGEPPSPTAARDELSELPPGVAPEARRMFAVDAEGGELAAWIDLLRDHPAPGVWYLGTMLVTPSERSRGLGSRLYRELEAWLREQGAREIRLCVFERSPEALRFWTRLGFVHRRDVPPCRFGQRIHARRELGKLL